MASKRKTVVRSTVPTPNDEDAQAEELLVLEARITGKSFREIERELGVSHAQNIFRRALARQPESTYRRAEAQRLESERIDALQQGIWARALTGEPRAVEVALKVLERRARLHGYDHADAMNSRLVEIEQQKVTLMATALVESMRAVGLPADQQEAVTTAFVARLRAAEEQPLQEVL